jgi:hypothetical protein
MKRYIKSAVDTTITIETLMERIEKIYYEKFPNSLCDVSYGVFLSSPYLFIRCYLAKDKSEVSSQILDNDVFSIRACVDFDGSPRDLEIYEPVPKNSELSFSMHSIMAVPDVDYLYCSHININVRKTSGDADKILSAWKRFVDKLYAETVQLYLTERLHNVASEYYNVADKLGIK